MGSVSTAVTNWISTACSTITSAIVTIIPDILPIVGAIILIGVAIMVFRRFTSGH